MTAAHYREQARLALMAGQRSGILPERAGLLWRTHDHGLMAFQTEGLDESYAVELRRLLGHGRQAAMEMAAFPLRLLYGLTPHGLQDLRLDALPGKGRVVEVSLGRICLCADPLACMEALAQAEERGREQVLGRLLDAPVKDLDSREGEAGTDGGSCGQCGGLLGCSACAGSACVRHLG